MFRKKFHSDELFLHFSEKVQNLTVFSIIYMIRIRFFGPRGINSELFFGRTVCIFRFCVIPWKDEREPSIKHSMGRQIDVVQKFTGIQCFGQN